jgi:hypothetical protein
VALEVVALLRLEQAHLLVKMVVTVALELHPQSQVRL